SDRDAEANGRDVAEQPSNAARNAHGANGDVAHVDRLRARVGQHADGVDHAVHVRERLAHSLEENSVDAIAGASARRFVELAQTRAYMTDLLDDLPRLEVAREPHAPCRAERARQRTAELRAHTDREAARPFERDPHALDNAPICDPERELHERIDAA